jgi:hypothetical protein
MANHSSTRDELLYRISALERQVRKPLSVPLSRYLLRYQLPDPNRCFRGWVRQEKAIDLFPLGLFAE